MLENLTKIIKIERDLFTYAKVIRHDTTSKHPLMILKVNTRHSMPFCWSIKDDVAYKFFVVSINMGTCGHICPVGWKARFAGVIDPITFFKYPKIRKISGINVPKSIDLRLFSELCVYFCDLMNPCLPLRTIPPSKQTESFPPGGYNVIHSACGNTSAVDLGPFDSQRRNKSNQNKKNKDLFHLWEECTQERKTTTEIFYNFK